MESRLKWCQRCGKETRPDGLWPELCGLCNNYYAFQELPEPPDPERHWEAVHRGLVMRLEEKAQTEKDVSKLFPMSEKERARGRAEGLEIAIALCRDILGVTP